MGEYYRREMKIEKVSDGSGFQKCLIWGTKFPSNVWLRIGAGKLRGLVRVCGSRVGDVGDVMRCDLRVLELGGGDVVGGGSGGDKTDKGEIHLAHHIIKVEGRQLPLTQHTHNVNSTMRSNHTLCQTSNHIQILRSAPIKTITLTVVFASENQKMDSKSMNESFLGEFIRDIFSANDIRVCRRTLVDLRQCPLSQSSLSFPRINYIFVHHCLFLHDGKTEVVGKVIPSTEILIESSHEVDYYQRLLESCQEAAMSSVGMEAPLRLVVDTIRMQNRILVQSKQTDAGHFSGGLLIAGSSSCGKTLVVREAARKLRTNLFVFDVSAESVHDAPSFSAASTAVFSRAVKKARHHPTLLLLQHLEFLGTSQGRTLEPSSRIRGKLVSHLCQLLDAIPANVSLTVVVTSSRPHLLPLSFRRAGRLQQEVYIRLPSERDRFKIIQSITQHFPAFLTCDLSGLAKQTPGFTRTDLKKLIRLINLKISERNGERVATEDIKYGLSRVVPLSMQGSVGLIDIQRGSSLDDIAGLRSVKLDLIKAIVWPLKHPDAFLTMGIHPPKGILLHGPPGCAKTSIVRAMACSYGTNFLSVTAAELFSSGVGDSEKIVADLFHRARLASPCILFVDELEAVVGSRQAKVKAANENILSTFLTEMDGVGVAMEIASSLPNSGKGDLSPPRVVVVAATNRPDLVDSALLRPGRLDRIVAVPPPNESERAEILAKVTEKMKLEVDVDLGEIARLTHLYSGADLVNLCKEAALLALAEDMDIRSVSMRHFLKSTAQSTPSLSKESLQLFQEYSRSS